MNNLKKFESKKLKKSSVIFGGTKDGPIDKSKIKKVGSGGKDD